MVACLEAFAANLTAKELRFETGTLNDGDNFLSISINNRRSDFFFSGDDDGTHVAIRTVVEKCPAEKIADMLILCNQLNAEYRWLKFYVDKKNNVIVADDAVLTPETAGDECFELLARTDGILNDVKPIIMRALYA